MNYNDPTKKKKKSKSGKKNSSQALSGAALSTNPLGSSGPTAGAHGIIGGPGSMGLKEIEIIAKKPGAEEIIVVQEDPSVGTNNPYKQLTRLSSDRGGKRAGFSPSVGRVVDDMQANTPERKKKRTNKTVEDVKKDWSMFKLPNEDQIS